VEISDLLNCAPDERNKRRVNCGYKYVSFHDDSRKPDNTDAAVIPGDCKIILVATNILCSNEFKSQYSSIVDESLYKKSSKI